MQSCSFCALHAGTIAGGCIGKLFDWLVGDSAFSYADLGALTGCVAGMYGAYKGLDGNWGEMALEEMRNHSEELRALLGWPVDDC